MLQQSLALWIGQYGYSAVFFLLIAGIVGLPVPDQLLLVISGYLVLTKSLSLAPTLVAAILGSIVGITLSYALGRGAGSYISKSQFAADRLENARHWFQRFGCWTLVFGYFIPGIRNLIGCSSGMMRLKMRYFAPYAYTGAVVSSLTCVYAGYFLGAQAGWVMDSIGRFSLLAVVPAIFLLMRKAMRKGVPEAVKTTTTATATSGTLE
jgi:membrane protein DedA with SNARE-associated domain